MFVFVMSFFVYLLLSWSGSMSVQEVTIAFFLSVAVVLVASSSSRPGFWSLTKLDPRRWWLFLRYVFGPFAVGLAQANWDVAKRVITGEINPGIVKFDPGLKTDMGRMMLANSITLTPGTLTVDIDDNGVFYIHAINLTSSTPTEQDICGSFGQWTRRIAG
ncbi:MAG: Na+/H+ antiporter subunit E [Synergistaceae bacterium]|jgi:multicomponent Na+:H+ antiporter subunit E|nr:Na+/H+ antiporter subunit E [Synergistaceae bacterium]